MPLALLSLGVAGVVGPLCPAAPAQQPTSSGSKSWTESITSPLKQGFDKLGHALNPNPKPKSSAVVPGPEDDAVSLKNLDNAKPGAELFVAIARLYEQAGKMAEAEQQYQLALNENRNHLPALLGDARLKDYLGKPNEAIQLYQRAAKAYPQQASIHNNLGLCYARQNRLDEAVAAMSRAAELEPGNPLYRNNIAAVLVDQGKLRDAFRHLREVHGDAAACYNMGYLLNKKNQPQAAMQYFALALRADPSMDAARQWLEYLQRSTAQARLSQHPVAAGAKVTSQPAMPPESALASPDEAAPRRLPPTTLRRPTLDGPMLPGISYERSTAPAAPLPPPPTSSTFRPLPRVN